MLSPATTSSILLFLRNLGSEVLVFISSELIIRFIYPTANTRSQKIKLLVTQTCLLAIAAMFLLFFHHRPFLLLLVAIFVFARVVSLHSGAELGDAAWRESHVSKPLRQSMNVEPRALPMQWSPDMAYGVASTVPASQPPTAYYPASSVVHRHTQGESFRSQPFAHTSSVQQPLTQRYGTVKVDSSSSATHQVGVGVAGANRLTRSKLNENRVENAHSLPPVSAQPQQSYLRYISSFWSQPSPSRSPPGLYNSGNLCFALSTLQALTWTPGFLRMLKSLCQQRKEATKDPSVKLQLLISLHSLLDRCHVLPDGTTSFSPIPCTEFLKTVSEMVPYLVAPPRRGHRQTQQDASEFLLWLLDNLDSNDPTPEPSSSESLTSESGKDFELAKKKEECLLQLESANSREFSTYFDPLIQLAEVDWELEMGKAPFLTQELFLGQMVEARECDACKKMSVNVEYFTILPLPIPGSSVGLSLKHCLNRFGVVENLTESNKIACSCISIKGDSSGSEEMKLTTGSRLAVLSRLPKRLVLQLSRFSYNTMQRCAQKNTTPITLPMTLDMTPYLMKYKLKDSEEKGKIYYTLYAVCIHTGAQSTTYGHYLAYCRATNGTWYFFNDSYVSAVENMELELQDPVLLENAYLALYSAADDSTSQP